jgi:probable rRNA maturation factor
VYQRRVAEDRIEVTAGRVVCGRRTMILLDPELEADSALASANAKKSAASGPQKSLGVPSTRALGLFLKEAQVAVGLKGHVTVLLTTDAALRDLNRRFRGKDLATDVLSFPSTNPAPNAEKIAGDLAISVETARGQAAEEGHSLGVELRVLMLHGLLHLAGYDHENDEGRMRRRERKLRAQLGLPLGLIERAARKPTKAWRRKP